MKQMSGRVIVLDRDGTIIVDRHFLGDPEGVEFMPGAAAGLKQMYDSGCRLIMVSNQSGIGRGRLTEKQVLAVNERLRTVLAAAGVRLEGSYYCPHAPDDGCDCRKPKPAMIERAVRELSFDPADAVFVGDKDSDLELGRQFGAATVLIDAPTSSGSRQAADVAVHGLDELAALLSAGKI
jgi:D-glycero-D-manno-heptose 1,7-bisphosphate phosphatase